MAKASKTFQPVSSPFGIGSDEAATTEAFENFVGGSQRAFRLVNLARVASNSASGNRFTTDMRRHINPRDLFTKLALREGFTQEQADAYWDHIR